MRLAGDRVLAALVVGGRSKLPRRCGLEFDPLDVTIKREIEIEPCLLPISNDIKAGLDLIAHGGNDRIILNLAHIGAAEDF